MTAQVDTTNTQAAVSTVELKQAQLGLREALAAVQAQGGNTVANLQALAEAEARLTVAAAAAKQEHTLLKQQLGLVAPEAGVLATEMDALGASMMGAFGAVALVGVLKGFLDSIVDVNLEVGKLNDRTGVSVQTLAGLHHEAEANDIAFKNVETALVRLGRATAVALGGGTGAKAVSEAFHRIGIEADDLKGKTPDQVFYMVANGMANAKTHGDALAASQALLGRGGNVLITLFKQHGAELENVINKSAAMTGITNESITASRNWEMQTANMTTIMRAGLIPVMQAAVPVMKGLESGGALLWEVFMQLATMIAGAGLVIKDNIVGMGTLMSDVVHGNLQKAMADAKVIGEKSVSDFESIGTQMKKNFQATAEFTKHVWEDVKPFKPLEDDANDAEKNVKDKTSEMIAQAKALSEKQIAAIENTRAANQLAYDQGKISAKQWADVDAQAVFDVRKAHEDYFAAVIRIYNGQKEYSKARTAALELEKEKIKGSTEASKELDKATVDLEKETKKLGQTSAKTWQDIYKDIGIVFKEMPTKMDSPFLQWQKDALNLNADLKKLGIEGVLSLRMRLNDVAMTEKRLNDAGVHDGKIWLEVQKAKLTWTIALMQAEGKATKQEEHDLQQVERELKKFDLQAKTNVKSMKDMTEEMKTYIGQFSLDMGSAFAAVLQGQQSFGQAMEQATGKMIASMASMWARNFMAMAIADMFFNPARAAAELAAAAALEMVASLAGSLGGGGSSGGGGGSANHPVVGGPQQEYQPASASSGGQNVPHLAGGGLVTGPTLAMLGEGDRREAVIPLSDANAMRSIADAIDKHMERFGGGGTSFYIKGMVSSDQVGKLAKKLTRQVQTGRTRLTASNTHKITRRGV